MLEDVPKEGSPLKITGSVMMAVASTKEEVLEKIKKTGKKVNSGEADGVSQPV